MPFTLAAPLILERHTNDTGAGQALRAQSMEGENLRPDVAEALEEMAQEAK